MQLLTTGTELVLVRHGETDWNLAGRIQGTTDIPLNDTGRRQARLAAGRLDGQRFDAVVTSPMLRAAESAQIIAGELGLPDPEPIAELRERSYGAAEGLERGEIGRRFPSGSIPGRERRSAVVARVLPVLRALSARAERGTYLVVTHGGVIGSVMRHVTAGALPERGGQLGTGSVHRFLLDGESLTLLHTEAFSLEGHVSRSAQLIR